MDLSRRDELNGCVWVIFCNLYVDCRVSPSTVEDEMLLHGGAMNWETMVVL